MDGSDPPQNEPLVRWLDLPVEEIRPAQARQPERVGSIGAIRHLGTLRQGLEYERQAERQDAALAAHAIFQAATEL
jgi:hypothetical protein